jgi:murein DD-endopeptidase MepM/ murein hydrolase activator NlpD
MRLHHAATVANQRRKPLASQRLYHLHFEVHVNGAAIDLRTFLMPLVSHVSGFNGEANAQTLTLTWDATLASWVNTSDGPIYDRSPQQPNSPGVHTYARFLAWHADPAQRVWVVWINQLDDGTVVNGWIDATNANRKWNPVTRTFVPQ